MYNTPTLQRFGTLRQLTLGGFNTSNTDTYGGVLSNGLGGCTIEFVNNQRIETCLNS